MSTPYRLAFGLEIELCLISQKKFGSWVSMASEVGRKLLKGGIPNHVGDQPDPAYAVWSIVPEITIASAPAKNIWGLELVSPVFELNTTWFVEIETIFTILRKMFKLQESDKCSTHIHFSQLDCDFDAVQLACLSQAALSFESCLDYLVPRARASAYWCRSNRQSPALAQCQALSECHDLLALAAVQSYGAASVVETMCLFPASSPYGRSHGYQQDFVHGKVYKWNLARLVEEEAANRTIEFRQPTGSRTPEEAAGWALLTLAFVAGAVAFPASNVLPEGNPSLMHFWEHICRGAEVLEMDPLSLDSIRTFLDRQVAKSGST